MTKIGVTLALDTGAGDSLGGGADGGIDAIALVHNSLPQDDLSCRGCLGR